MKPTAGMRYAPRKFVTARISVGVRARSSILRENEACQFAAAGRHSVAERNTTLPVAKKRKRRRSSRYWSASVTKNSRALELEPSVFKRTPLEMARSLKRSAERSKRRKSSPFRSAMSMLTFYENRAGRGLSPERVRAIRKAKDELRKLFGQTARKS